jgi:hypothetical protein
MGGGYFIGYWDRCLGFERFIETVFGGVSVSFSNEARMKVDV